MDTLYQRAPQPGAPVRVVIAKPGLDGHDRGRADLKSIVETVRQAGVGAAQA
jgi:methylmalonyl-CoA mutase cobalamin-binding subunit